MISAGSTGRSSQSQAPSMASQIRVKTRLAATPPSARIHAAAACMWSAAAGSPARRRATYASMVVDRSPGPPKKVAQVPSGLWLDRIHRAAGAVDEGSRTPRK